MRPSNGGYTVVEMLIVIAISALLLSTVILYSRTGERQILLIREQGKLISTLFRAKSLTVQFMARTDIRVCGYGVHFLPDSYILFNDAVPITQDCSASDKQYSGSSENIEVVALDKLIKFNPPLLTDVLFIPPDPKTILIPTQEEAILTLATSDNASSVKIKISNAGQITIQ